MEVVLIEVTLLMKISPKSIEQVESLEQRLNAHPELKAKIKDLLSVVENAQGDLIRTTGGGRDSTTWANRFTRMGHSAASTPK
jgi:hypothetical protein